MYPMLRAPIAWAIWALLQAGPAQAAVGDGYVAVISVDGLGASELSGKPSCLAADSTIRSLAARGAYSRGVKGVLPTITYPSHASLVTGTTPAKHGVIDNGLRGAWFKERSHIRVPTLWDAARAAGKSVAIVTWPSTYGAQVDYLVPEDLNNFAVPTEDIRNASSAGLFDSLAAAAGKPTLLPFTHADAGTPLDEMTARFAAEVVRRHKPRLLLTHFLDYDHRMHAAPWSAEACKSLERSDAWVAHILAAYRDAGILDRTTVFVVSDHGFLEVKQVLSIFAMLKDVGWSQLFADHEVSAAFELKLAGGSAAFYPQALKSSRDKARVAGELRARVEKQYAQAVRWITPAQAQAMGGFPGSLFTLCARPGYSLTAVEPSRTEVFIKASKYRGAHGYCPDEPQMNAMFVASGFGVRAAGAIDTMSMVDVGPTIAAFLGVKLPEASGRDRSARFRTAP